MASPTFVQVLGSAAGASPATSVDIPITANATSGNTVIIPVKGSSSLVVSSASDTRGNTYIVDISNATSANTISIVRGYMASPLQNGDTVTITMTGSGNIPSGEVYEYKGMYKLASSFGVDKSAATGGTGVVTLTTPAFVTTDATDVLISAITVNNNGITGVTLPASFTARGTVLSNAGGLYLRLADRNPAATASYTAQWSWTTSANAAIALVAYMAEAPLPNNYQFVSAGDGISVTEKIR